MKKKDKLLIAGECINDTLYHYLVCDGNQDQDSGAAVAVWIIDLLRSQLLTTLLLCLTLTFFTSSVFTSSVLSVYIFFSL